MIIQGQNNPIAGSTVPGAITILDVPARWREAVQQTLDAE